MIEVNAFDLHTLPYVSVSEAKKLPSESGVYFVLNAADDLFYVGSSTNLNTRWMGHHRKHEFKKIPCAKIAYYLFSGDIKALEKALIEKLKPSQNWKRVSKQAYSLSIVATCRLALHAELGNLNEDEMVQQIIYDYLSSAEAKRRLRSELEAEAALSGITKHELIKQKLKHLVPNIDEIDIGNIV